MKEKILAAIKAKFPKVNLSKARLNAIAAKIETKVIDDETKIDAAIDEFNDFNPLAEIAKNDDKIRNLEAKNPPAPAKKDDTPGKEEDQPGELPADMPEWAKALVKSNQSLQQTVATIAKKDAQTSISAKVQAAVGKDVPASYYKNWPLPEKEEDIETFVESIKTDYTAFQQEQNNAGLDGVPPPGGGNGAATKPDDTKVPDVVKQAAEKIKADIAANKPVLVGT